MSLLRRAAVAIVASAGALALAAGSAAAAPSPQDQEWLVAAHQSNLAEIAAGQAAVERGTTETVRHHGQMLIDDHTRLDAALTPVAQQLGVTLPAEPSPAQQQALAEVVAQPGEAFDRAWIASQIASHRATLAAGQEEIANGTVQAVKDLAAASAPVVQGHLDALLAAAQEHGVPTSVPGGSGGQAASSPGLLGGALVAGGALAVAGAGVLLLRRRPA
jgi:putative membrane protein